MTSPSEILSFTSDHADAGSIENWAERQTAIVNSAVLTQDQRDSFVAVTVADLDPLDPALRRRFVNAALLADWACYSVREDRAEYDRLRDVIDTFPQGFRVWFCKMPDRYMPVAYTGWYPISEEVFNKAHDRPQDIRHRVELYPQSALSDDGSYIWVFNYSIIKPLRKSGQSRKMLKAYAADINAIHPRGLAAAVISEESKNVVRKFGMSLVGNMTHMGVSEEVWAVDMTPKFKPEPIVQHHRP